MAATAGIWGEDAAAAVIRETEGERGGVSLLGYLENSVCEDTLYVRIRCCRDIRSKRAQHNPALNIKSQIVSCCNMVQDILRLFPLLHVSPGGRA